MGIFTRVLEAVDSTTANVVEATYTSLVTQNVGFLSTALGLVIIIFGLTLMIGWVRYLSLIHI